MNKSNKFSAEVLGRAVRMVREHRDESPSQWSAIRSIASRIGCTSQTLLGWVKRNEVDSGKREGVMECEVEELRCASEILKPQDVSIGYSERLAQAGIEPSVGSRRDSYDNTLTETINGLYKAELIHRRAP